MIQAVNGSINDNNFYMILSNQKSPREGRKIDNYILLQNYYYDWSLVSTYFYGEFLVLAGIYPEFTTLMR